MSKLQKQLNQIPTALKNLILSYTTIEGEKFDGLIIREDSAYLKHYDNERKQGSYFSKIMYDQKKIEKLKAQREQFLKKNFEDLKKAEDRIFRYKKFRTKLSEKEYDVYNRWIKLYHKKNEYLEIEKSLEEYRKYNHNFRQR